MIKVARSGEIDEFVWQTLKMQSFKVKDPSPRLMSELQQALDTLPAIFPLAAETIATHTTLLAWLSPLPGTESKDLFACSSFHEYLGCTFLTDLSLRHIPANVVFPTNCTYALQENLYHEALHQKFCSMIDDGQVFIAPLEDVRRFQVYVPWRDAYWNLEKAAHAYYVYSHLNQMRMHVLESGQLSAEIKGLLEQGVIESKNAVSVLGQGIREGRRLLKRITKKAGMKYHSSLF
jgi:hypothetical protein